MLSKNFPMNVCIVDGLDIDVQTPVERTANKIFYFVEDVGNLSEGQRVPTGQIVYGSRVYTIGPNAFPSVDTWSRNIVEFPIQNPLIRTANLSSYQEWCYTRLVGLFPSLRAVAEPLFIQFGDVASLFWESTNASRVLISEFGEVDLSGIRAVTPRITTTYTFLAIGPAGVAYAVVTLTVDGSSVNISIEPDDITVGLGRPAFMTVTTENSGIVWPSDVQGSYVIDGQSVRYYPPKRVGVYEFTVTSDIDPDKTATAIISVTEDGGIMIIVVQNPVAGTIVTAGSKVDVGILIP